MLGLGLGLNRAAAFIKGIVKAGLQLWLDFEKSEVVGSELVINGTFDTDTGWNKNPNWTISNGVATSDGSANTNMNQIIPVIAGATYEISFDIVSISQGGYRVKVGAVPTEYYSTVGSHTERIVAFNTERLKVELTGSSIGTIDNISVKEVTQFAKDKSPNTNNAKLFTGKALSFDGVNDWVDCGNDSALNLTDNFTLVTTVKLSASLGNGGGVVTRSKGTDDGYGLSIDSNGKFSFPRYTSSSAKSDVAAVVGEVYRVVSVQDSGVNKLYVNGVLQSTMGSQVVTSTTENFVLGRLYGAVNNYYLSGDLSDIQIYNKAWNASDVAFDYNNPNHLAIDDVDRAEVLSDNLALNGNFDSGLEHWALGSTGSHELIGGKLKMTSTSISNILSKNTSVSGKKGYTYMVTQEATDFVGGTNGYFRLDGVYNSSNIISFNASSPNVTFVADRDFDYIQYFASTSDCSYTIDNVVVKEITQHASHLTLDNLKGYWALSEGDGLVAYDSGSTLEEDLIQNGDFSELGTDLVTNGDFSDGLNGWSYSNVSLNLGGAEINNVGLNNVNAYIQHQNLTVSIGESYKLTYDVLETNGRSLLIEQDGTDTDLDTSTVGNNKVIYFNWDKSNLALSIKRNYLTPETKVTLDNIRLEQVDPNDEWVLLGNTSINDNSINVEGLGWLASTGNYWSARQANIFTVGKTYEVKFRARQVSGSGNFLVGQAYQVGFTQAITNSFEDYSFNITALTYNSSSDRLSMGGLVIGDKFEVESISVKEITQSAHGSNITPTSGDLIGATYVDKQPTIPQLGMMDWAKGSNLLPYSNDFTEWANNGGTLTPNFAIAPNGNQTASKYNIDGAYRIFRYLLDLSTSTEYTFSFYVKNISSDDATYRIYDNTNAADIIGATSYYSQISTTEWSRVDITFTTSATGTEYGVYMMSGIATGDILFWGAQVEESSSAGNYILTDGAAAIDVTTIQNPNNKGFDILGNPLRLREHGFNLDGSGYGEIADDDSLDFGTGAFSMEVWAKANYVNHASFINQIISLGGNGAGAGSASIQTERDSGKITAYVNTFWLVANAPYVAGQWYHIVVTRDNSGLCKLYIDTEKQTDEETTTGSITNSNVKHIGRDSTNNREYTDLIDEPKIYNRALTLKEIKQNYKSGINKHKATSSYSDDYSSDYGL